MNPILARYVSFDHCRALLPWFEFAAGHTPHARARRAALAWENEAAGHGQPNRVVAFLLYVPSSLRQMAIASAHSARQVRRDFAIGYLRQFADLLFVTWRLNHAPHDYYLQKMWLRPQRRDWAQFLSQREHVLLVKQLQRTLPLTEFDDKLKLHDRLKAAGIPTIDVLLAAVGGQWRETPAPEQMRSVLRQDLVIKPSNGTMYDGVEIWGYDEKENLYSGPPILKTGGVDQPMAEEKLDLPALLQRVLRLSEKRPYLVQGRMKNHPTLEAMSPHAIANFRLVTVSRAGKFTVISAVLRMSYDSRKFIPGTYQANVDLRSGELGFATGCLPQWGYGRTHLETGAPVTGLTVANWPDLQSLALRAHGQYPWMPSIGWDIIHTDEGPRVMEANAFWGANISQVDCPFLGETGYAEAFWEAYELSVQTGG